MLLDADGVLLKDIVERVGVSKPTLIGWKKRYAAEGIGRLRTEAAMSVGTSPARATADFAAAAKRRNLDVCDTNTRRGDGRPPNMAHSIPAPTRPIQVATTSPRQHPSRSEGVRGARRYRTLWARC